MTGLRAVLAVFFVLVAAASAVAQPARVYSQAASQADDNPWAFDEDDEPVETWQQLVADQAVALGVFAGCAARALPSFFRESVKV